MRYNVINYEVGGVKHILDTYDKKIYIKINPTVSDLSAQYLYVIQAIWEIPTNNLIKVTEYDYEIVLDENTLLNYLRYQIIFA